MDWKEWKLERAKGVRMSSCNKESYELMMHEV